MYDPAVIAERDLTLRQQSPTYRTQYPRGLPTFSFDDCHLQTAQILQKYDRETETWTHGFTADEQHFIAVTKFRVGLDVPYYLNFVWIDEEGHGLRPLYPLWDSQAFLLRKIAQLEHAQWFGDSLDGILINVLKVRQVGISTLGVALVSHRIFTQTNIRAIVGSDTEEQAKYLFRMIERIYQNLPPFLRPGIVSHLAGREMVFSNGSSIKTAWGKTTRGALQEVGGRKGNIERGRTNSVVHISELATWDNPEQLDSALLPGVPISPKTLMIFESTAELAGDWWHQHYLAAEEGAGRFRNAFIAWPIKYTMPAPVDWSPCEETLAVAASIERDSPRWGYPLSLTRDHLYWYETTRAYYVSKNQLHTFLTEYPSNPEECFQYAGQSVFSLDELAQIDQAARPVIDVWAVEPSREIAELRRMAESSGDLKEDAKALALREDKRPAAPLVTRVSTKDLDKYPVPPGYGFRRLSQLELEGLPNLRHSVLAIHEYPRTRGPRRYVIGVDVGDGLGLDDSSITVTRLPTIEEPAEDVAQYVSNTMRPSNLAFICDAIGRFYSDEEGLEALMAVELNNHGITVQDLLQLHLGYTNFYVWEVVDAADPAARYTKRIGWSTTSRTRPILLEKFHDAVVARDPITDPADFRLNSPVTRAQLRHFVTDGLLGEAEHAKGQRDDSIFSAAISYYVAWRQAGGESEPVAEKRRRRQELRMVAAQTGRVRDWRNSAITAEELKDGDPDEAEFDELYQERNRA